MPIASENRAVRPNPDVVLTKAVVRAADKLGVKARLLAAVLGVAATLVVAAGVTLWRSVRASNRCPSTA